MAVTLKMLSEQTGFSPATISRVLNNDPSMTVGEDTRRIIFDAAHRLGYSGSSGRRNQRTLTDTLFIGIAEMLSPAEQMTDPYFLYLKNFIEQTCYEHKLQTVPLRLVDGEYQTLSASGVDGVIAISFSKSNCEKIYQLINKPIVSIDAYGELDAGQENHVLNIGLDDESGGYLMTKYLLECGYEHIQVCAGRDNGVDHFRYMGAQRAAKEFAGKKQKVQFTALGMNYAKRKESYAWLIQRKKPKTALFFLSDLYALEAISFFSSRGVKIPEEIGIAGYDNISYAEFSVPRLTTISQNVEQKASLAVEILMERINGVEKERENEIELPVTLIPRKSLQPQEEEK